MASEGPPEKDVKDFRFQQLCRVRVFDRPDPSDGPPDKVTQLLACSSVFGFTFIGTKTGFHVIRTSDLTEVDNEHSTDRTTVVVTNFPFWVKFNLNGRVSHLALSCDDLTLAVVVTINGVVQTYMYDVHGFSNKGSVFEPFLKVRMSSAVLDLAWNPAVPAMIVACLEDGSISLLKITDKLEIVASRPSTDAARCVCWSPKGKQLVVGTGKGTLVQFDQELKEKRNWGCPDLFPPDQQVEVKGLVWVSTYMFLVSYLEGGSDQPTVVLVTGSKDAAPMYTSFEDPCYGNGEGIASMVHFKYIQNWETILCTSRTACETSMIGKHFDNKNVFEHWILDDAARAELPLTEDYQDTFPLGVAVDLSSQFSIPVGENFHPPSPIFLLLSTDGVLVPYYMMYSHSEAGTITRPSQALPSVPIRTGKATGTVQRDAQLFGTSVANSGNSGPSILGQPAASPQISASQESTTKPSLLPTTTTQSASQESTTKPSLLSTTTQPVFGAGTQSQPFSFSSAASNTSLGQGSQSQPFSFSSAASNTSLGQGSQSQPFSFSSAASNTSLGQGSQSQPFSLTPTSSNTSLGQGSQSQPFSFTPTNTKSTMGLLTTGSTAGFQFGTPSSVATATTNSASSAGSPAVRSLFGTPSGITGRLASSGSTTGATSTQIGQSFLASALSSAESEATVKTGFAASTQASSIFSFKQPAQGSSNFNISAALPKPTSAPTDLTKTNSSSFSTTKPEDSKSGFNFSLNTPKSEMTDSKLSQPSLGNEGGASVFGGSNVSAGAAKLPSSSTVPSSDKGLFGGAAVTSKSTASFGGLSTSSTSKPSTGSTTPSTASGFTAFTGTQQQPPNSTATLPKAGSVGTSSALSTGFGLGGTTAATAKGFGSTGGLPTFGNLQASTSQDPGKSASVPPQRPTIPAAGSDSSLRTQPSPATEDTLKDTFSASIAEEMADFERELREFKQRAGKTKEEVGIEEEMKKLRNNAIDMSRFCNEVRTNTKEQSKEISDLKSLCLDAFAMVEDCRMREQKNTDPQYNFLLRNKALDPASLETQRNLQQQQQLLDQGLRDVDAILDQEWQEYQSRKKNRNKIQRPTTDGIYQVMKSNRNLIIGQRNQLDELESQLKQLRMYNRRSEWKQPNNSGETAELSLLADTLLESTNRSPEKLNRTSRNDASISQKHANLREYLSRRSVSKVKSTRPENLSMSKLASTEKLREVLSRQESSPAHGRAATAENKPSSHISGRPILRATSHNGANKAALNRQVRPEMATPKSWQTEQVKSGFQQPNSFQLQPNITFVAGAGRGSVMATKMLPAELLSDQYENISSTDATEDDEDDEYDDEDDDDGEGFGQNYNMDNEESPDSEMDSRLVNRKIPERKPAVSITPSAAVSGFGGTSQSLTMSGFGSKPLGTSQVLGMPGVGSKPLGTSQVPGMPLGTSQASASSGGFNFAAASKLTFGSSADKPSLTEAKTSAASAPSSFKFENTSTPKTAFKFGSESEVQATGFAFSGKNLFGQPLKSQTVTTTTVTVTSSGESLSKGNSLLAKALSEDSDEEAAGTDDKTLTGNEPEISKPTTSVTTSNSPASHGLLGKYLSLPQGSLTAAVNNDKESKSSDGHQSNASASGLFGKSTTPSQETNTAKPFSFGSSSNVDGGGLFGKSAAETTTKAESNVFGGTNSGQTRTGLFGQMVSQISSTSSDVVENTSPTQSNENAASQQIPKSETEKSTDTGLFGTTSGALDTSSVSSGQTSTSSTGLFGQASASTGTGLFGNSVKTSLTDTTGSEGQTKTSADDAGLFGKTTETSNSGSGHTTSTTAGTMATGLFGQTTSPSTVGTGLFGQTNSTSTSSGGTGLFGQTSTSNSGTGLFGQGVTPTTSSTGSGLFGKSLAPTNTTGTGLFGQPSTTNSGSTGLFGQSGSGLFGQTSTASSSGGGLFGQTTTASSSGGGLFGQTTAASSSGGGLFGQTTTVSSSGGGMFGQTTTVSSSGGGLFGQTTAASSSGGGLFGQTTTVSSSSGGMFGQTTTASSSSGGLFGQSSTGGFGQTSSPSRNLFGGSTFGTQGTSSSSPFGQTSTLFGSASTSSATAGFGSGPGFGQQSSGFGQTTSSSASPFGAFGSPSTSSGGFGGSGGLFSGLGGKPSEEKANTNVFGSVPAFGNTGNTSGGLFGGGQTSNPFGGGSPSSFTGGSFSGGNSNVASAGFGVAKQQSPGFGGAATFGGSPAFGGTSGFGSPPTFGGGSAFGSGASFSNPAGSPQSSGTSGGFSGFANNSNSPTFGALAQNSSGTPSFGNIAQESSPAFGGGFSGGGGGFGASPGFGNQTPVSGNPAFTGYRS